MALITCEHVCLGYDGQTVLRDVNFTVSRGDLLCVVGENGSGKSTLIKGLLGLKAPEQGSITLGDGLEYLPAKLEILKSDAQSEALITIHEGKFHQIKRMMAYLGKPVLYLERVRMGNLLLDPVLERGTYRLLTKEEWQQFLATYAGGKVLELWEAVKIMCQLFDRTARSVCEALHYSYDEKEAEACMGFLERVHRLPKDAKEI